MPPRSPLGSWHLLPSSQSSLPFLGSCPQGGPGYLTRFPNGHSQSSSRFFWDVIFCSPSILHSCLSSALPSPLLDCPHHLLTGLPASGTSSACIHMSFLKGKWDTHTHTHRPHQGLQALSEVPFILKAGNWRHPIFKEGSLGSVNGPPTITGS